MVCPVVQGAVSFSDTKQRKEPSSTERVRTVAFTVPAVLW
jgi:hypothetical protein